MRGKPINGCLIDDARAAVGYLQRAQEVKDLPEIPRWVEAHGIAGDPTHWRRGARRVASRSATMRRG